MNIKFPIQKAYSSENYGLIILDGDGVTHYFDFDGTYDGHSNNTNLDEKTRSHLN
ncbi:hypothetical protein KAR91_73285 [Candidatus Pacearchaeota archaeon]|nr:hypothetical protein [Candidatus Pacearchaeota archaeon]